MIKTISLAMFKKKFFWQIIILLGITVLYLQSCDRLSVEKDLEGVEYNLVDQDSSKIAFPEDFSGKVMLVGYVYTHCPDICPMITYNMRDVQKELGQHEDFMLVSVSFDPTRDTPTVLSNYANSYSINQNNWRLLTGDKDEVDSLLEELEIATVKTPTRFTEDNTPIYFIDHTDRVSLIDREGRVRNSYLGSELSSEEVIQDLEKLLNET